MGKDANTKRNDEGWAELQRLALRTWRQLMSLEQFVDVDEDVQMRITEIRVRVRRDPTEETLVIVKGRYEGDQLVAFHSAREPGEALRGALERLENRSLTWKVDKPYQPK